MMRIFAINTSIPVVAACEICGVAIKVERKRDPSGNQWISGVELLQAWLDHQLTECCVPEEIESS